MDIRPYFKALNGKDRQKQFEAIKVISKETESKVTWAYSYWDQLEKDLEHKKGNRQVLAVKFLSNLAISDSRQKIFETFEKIKDVTESETAATQREALSYIWRIALAGPKQQTMIVNYLIERYEAAAINSQFRMLKTDLLVSLQKIYLSTNDESLKETIDDLINQETDLKQYKQTLKAIEKIEL